jgi:hypothetical protein
MWHTPCWKYRTQSRREDEDHTKEKKDMATMGNAPILVHFLSFTLSYTVHIDSYPLPSAQSKNLNSYFKGSQRRPLVNSFPSPFLSQFCPQSRWLSRQLGTKDENKVWDSLWKSGWHYEYLYVYAMLIIESNLCVQFVDFSCGRARDVGCF